MDFVTPYPPLYVQIFAHLRVYKCALKLTHRVLVSKNKSRFTDLNNEFDLDLTYIVKGRALSTEGPEEEYSNDPLASHSLIAMGVPVGWKFLSLQVWVSIRGPG